VSFVPKHNLLIIHCTNDPDDFTMNHRQTKMAKSLIQHLLGEKLTQDKDDLLLAFGVEPMRKERRI
jgi:hypothetical protein